MNRFKPFVVIEMNGKLIVKALKVSEVKFVGDNAAKARREKKTKVYTTLATNSKEAKANVQKFFQEKS